MPGSSRTSVIRAGGAILALTAGAGLLAGATLGPARAEETIEGPSAEITPLAVDFGDVARGEFREARFTIRNRGNETLVLQEVDPVCACTVASYDRTIEPGGTGEIVTKLDTHGLSGNERRGVTVVTNDPRNRIVFLELFANVLTEIQVFPETDIRLGNYRALSRRATVLLRREPSRAGAGELAVSEAVSTSDSIRVVAERLEAPSALGDGLPVGQPGDWLLQLELLPAAPAGSERHEVRLRTGLESLPELTIPVWSQVLAPAVFTPGELVLQADTGTAQTSGEVQGLLRMGRGGEGEELELVADPPVLDLVLERNGPRQIKIRATLREDAPPTETEGGTVRLIVGGETAALPFRVVRPH